MLLLLSLILLFKLIKSSLSELGASFISFTGGAGAIGVSTSFGVTLTTAGFK